MSAFSRYASGEMPAEEAGLLGLPGYGDSRFELVERIKDFRKEKEKTRMGDPAKGFDFAISASRILTGVREPLRVLTVSSKMIRPLILHAENDIPLWEGFRVVFPTIAEATGVSMHVNKVDTARNLFEATEPTPLASHAGMLLVAQSFQVALDREKGFAMWGTNPAQHLVVTFEAEHSSINLSNPTE